ncbi:MAG: hypothetical protein ACLQJR_23750, partial [Stellaceae bacterium]
MRSTTPLSHVFVQKNCSRPRFSRNSIRLSVATFIESPVFRRHRGFDLMKAKRKAKAAASKGAAKKAPKRKKAV